MKSQLLIRQLKEIFAGEGELPLRALLNSAQAGSPILVAGVEQLLDKIDVAYGSYAGMLHWQGDFDNSISQWQKLVHPDDLRELQSRIAAHAQSKEQFFQAECRLKARDSQWRWLMIRGVVTGRGADGEVARILVLHRDISDVKVDEGSLIEAKEAAESANRARFPG